MAIIRNSSMLELRWLEDVLSVGVVLISNCIFGSFVIVNSISEIMEANQICK